MLHESEARDKVARVEALLEHAEALPDPAARETATELVAALLDVYGEGLARLVVHVAERDGDGELARALAEDELVSHLLLLHGLHPIPLETRVRGALDQVRPYLESHGGGVELAGIDDGVVRLRLKGSCDGCPSSARTLKLAVEDAIQQAAPDVVSIEAEGAVEAAPPSGLLQLEIAPSVRAPEPHAAWSVAGVDVPEGAPAIERVDGEDVLFVRLGGRLYAYQPGCPGCGRPLADADLHGDGLACAGCGATFDVRRAGASLGLPGLQLEPVPLLEDGDGSVRVALGSAA